MDHKQFKKLVDFCRKNGVISLKNSEIEINLSPSALFPTKPLKHSNSDYIPTDKKYTDEDILLWSSAGIPEEGVQ